MDMYSVNHSQAGFQAASPQIAGNKKPAEITSTGFSIQRQADQKSSNRHTS
jgi:hypothetical protein